jgi:hypothetical protein
MAAMVVRDAWPGRGSIQFKKAQNPSHFVVMPAVFTISLRLQYVAPWRSIS